MCSVDTAKKRGLHKKKIHWNGFVLSALSLMLEVIYCSSVTHQHTGIYHYLSTVTVSVVHTHTVFFWSVYLI